MPRDKDHLAVKTLYSGMATDKAQDLRNDLLDFEALAGPLRILGYPSREQRGCLQMDCELYFRGYTYSTRPKDTSEFDESAAEWDLLSQFYLYYDEVWPDYDGFIHFWIRKRDLAKADFSRIAFTWDIS